jgi:hypothetical protein
MFKMISGQHSPEYKEARRLAWQSLHVPYGTLLFGSLAMLSLLSAVSSIFFVGPVNGIQ